MEIKPERPMHSRAAILMEFNVVNKIEMSLILSLYSTGRVIVRINYSGVIISYQLSAHFNHLQSRATTIVGYFLLSNKFCQRESTQTNPFSSNMLVKSNKHTTTFISLLTAVLTLQHSSFVLNVCVYGWISYELPARRHGRRIFRIKQESDNQLQLRKLRMVRNIDLPEAVIFYGTKTLIPSYVANESDDDAKRRFRDAEYDDDASVIQARSGLARFLQECHEIETAVIVLLDGEDDDDDSVGIEHQHAKRTNSHVLDAILNDKLSRPCYVFTQTVVPPDPTDVLAVLNLIYIQPRPYGGSTIGYRRAADPERLIAPQHCVAFTTTVQQTRIARALGMRVLSMNIDDHLADAVLMESDDDDNMNVSINLSVDDIATPGSYWLNPPHPRDDNGNQVLDPYDILKKASIIDQSYIRATNNFGGGEIDNEDDDAYFQTLLADIAPLKGSD